MKTAESRLPKIEPTNGDQEFTLKFTKADADALMSCLDITLKASGLPAAQAVNLWATKVRDGMQITSCADAVKER